MDFNDDLFQVSVAPQIDEIARQLFPLPLDASFPRAWWRRLLRKGFGGCWTFLAVVHAFLARTPDEFSTLRRSFRAGIIYPSCVNHCISPMALISFWSVVLIFSKIRQVADSFCYKCNNWSTSSSSVQIFLDGEYRSASTFNPRQRYDRSHFRLPVGQAKCNSPMNNSTRLTHGTE